ncbi:hypothetical protein F5884DRAFT_792245 [Xylogone sp. PMI_703]|nr:hypothetical protein F5884DRAFT_792245 [Xylogone sp. PMI_703]
MAEPSKSERGLGGGKKIAQFPDVENKLQAPTKKSLFERQKAEAEAKRLREAAETAAVYEDFVKSFDNDDDDADAGGGGGGRFGGRPGGMGLGAGFGGGLGGKRQFASSSSLNSGPGGGGFLGRGNSGPGTLEPPGTGLSKKRSYDGFQRPPRREDRGLLAFDDYEEESRAPARALKDDHDDDDEKDGERSEERAVPKPTMRLASLPPGTSPAFIKSLLPSSLKVDSVRILPPSGPGTQNERKSMTAIVTLTKETAASDIDSAVNSLQNKYLGYGYYLSLHRHLSSAAISSSASGPSLGNAAASQPFGAKPVALNPAGRGHAPPPHQRGFAPPTSYTPTGPGQLNRNAPLLHVPVQPPQDVKELKLIHKVIESLLTHGPEFEALLMSRPEVQREEKWAWLWDPRSTGGVWYRWRLWEILTGSQTPRGQGRYLPLFEGSSAWKAPDVPLPYEYATALEEFVSDSEYNSSDEDDSGDEGARRPPLDGSGALDEGKAYLNPLEKAKLTHLLARLPTSTGKLRKGDVARVTAFAISHAGRGADEVVAAIVSNVEKPFAYTSANPDRQKSKDAALDDGAHGADDAEEKSDTSSASLIGIYIISDILSSSSTSGVRHAWRYRQLFETALRQRKIFEGLGRMEKKLNWGRLRAEKWKRSVNSMLSLWEGWCVFPQESQDHFVNTFNNPPLLPSEEKEAREREALAEKERAKSRWKAVEVAAKEREERKADLMKHDSFDGEPMADNEDVDGTPMEDVDGEPMEDEDVDGEPMEDIDGEAMDDVDGEPMEEDTYEPPPAATTPAQEQSQSKEKSSTPKPDLGTAPIGQPRRRPRAVDMFADSDDSE